MHIRSSINKANSVLATLKHTFKTWSPRTFKQLFETFVRPHLEYAAAIWNPSRSHQIKAIETVQRRATKLVKSTRGLSYERRLEALGMVSLEHRRHRGDLIQAYKCLNGLNRADLQWHRPCESRRHSMQTRETQHTIRPDLTRYCTPRATFFTNRIARQWSALAPTTVNATTLNKFKAALDIELSMNNILTSYTTTNTKTIYHQKNSNYHKKTKEHHKTDLSATIVGRLQASDF